MKEKGRHSKRKSDEIGEEKRKFEKKEEGGTASLFP